MDTSQNIRVTVEAVVNAPIEKVWKYWNAPEHITRWCAASEDWHAPFSENDLRKGGKFRTTMAAKDGSFSFDFEGVYTKVEPYERIEYAMSDGREVEITFSQVGASTKIVETFDAERENSVEMQRNGWQAILDNFKKHTESN